MLVRHCLDILQISGRIHVDAGTVYGRNRGRVRPTIGSGGQIGGPGFRLPYCLVYFPLPACPALPCQCCHANPQAWPSLFSCRRDILHRVQFWDCFRPALPATSHLKQPAPPRPPAASRSAQIASPSPSFYSPVCCPGSTPPFPLGAADHLSAARSSTTHRASCHPHHPRPESAVSPRLQPCCELYEPQHALCICALCSPSSTRPPYYPCPSLCNMSVHMPTRLSRFLRWPSLFQKELLSSGASRLATLSSRTRRSQPSKPTRYGTCHPFSSYTSACLDVALLTFALVDRCRRQRTGSWYDQGVPRQRGRHRYRRPGYRPPGAWWCASGGR